MSTDLIDISLAVSSASVVWPSAPKPLLSRRLSIERGDSVNDSDLFMNVHTGTHIDAPSHHIDRAPAADSTSLESLIGEAWVLDVSGCRDVDVDALECVWPPKQTKRVLLKTRNSESWRTGREDFMPDYAALTESTADWLVERGVQLIGIDYLSIQRFADPPTVHRVLLGAGVVVLEGLNLSHVPAGRYELICLPLKLVGADGAPARAVLRSLS